MQLKINTKQLKFGRMQLGFIVKFLIRRGEFYEF